MEELFSLGTPPAKKPRKRAVSKRSTGRKPRARRTPTFASSGSSIVKETLSCSYTPSVYQMGVYNFLKEETGSCIVDAKAGAGKTSTVEMIGKNLNQSVSGQRQFVLMLAFNKGIAAELGSRMPDWIKCGTFHSIGMLTWGRHVKSRLEVKAGKVRGILKDLLEEKEYRSFSGVACKLIGLAKNAGIGTWLREDTEDAWSYLLSHHCVNIGSDSDGGTDRKSRLISICRQALEQNNKMRTVIDFDDMLYLPVLEGCYFFRNHLVFVDEAQDTNLIQLAMLKRLLRKNGRLIAVGDPNQAIYGFRGADSQAIDKLIRWFKCKVLPLSICYRCDRAIVEKAQEIVPEIEYYEGNGEGKVESLPDYDAETFKTGDAILCRNTAPLIRFAYGLIGRRVPAKVMGREIGAGLVKLIKDLKSESINTLGGDLQDWSDKQTARLAQEEGSETAIGMINDKVECIKIFLDNLDRSDFTISGLCKSIHSLFSDDDNVGVQLGTVHRSKGHEWDRVFILDSHLMPSRYARLEWQRQQEINLQYVAFTRAKHYLAFMSSECWKD
jgi:DNA helicase II / ATP-dependent DNA helicase PcrA